MAVNIGELQGVAQIMELRGGIVFINDEPMPIKNVTQEELDALAERLASGPQGDDEAAHALRCAKQVEFIVTLLSRTVGNECIGYLERLMAFLHYDVLRYLGEAEDLEELDEGEDHPVEPMHDDEDGEEHHHHHCGCGHDHHEGDGHCHG